MPILTKDIVKLRQLTGAGIMDCREALRQAQGKLPLAQKYLLKKGLSKAASKKDRITGAGTVQSYIHHGSQIGGMVVLACETDFVARTADFQKLAKEICLQVASMDPKDSKALLSQAYIRDQSKTIQDLVAEAIARFGENIKITDFCRLAVNPE